MAKVGEAELKNQIKSGDFSNVYMIYGEEDYLKEYYVNKLKDKIVEPAFADFNFHQYDGKKTPVSEILNDADMMPMMADAFCSAVISRFPTRRYGGCVTA